MIKDIWYLFMNLLVIFMSYLKNYLFNSTVQFITRLFGFFGIELYILFGILTSYQIKDLQIFSLIAYFQSLHRLPFLSVNGFLYYAEAFYFY